MKTAFQLLLACLLTATAPAEFKVWTRTDGKTADHDFEVILITSDNDEKAMDGYAAEMKMPWPQLKLAKTAKFKQEFHHPGGGIPNLVLTDLQGDLIKTSYEGATYVGPTVVMNHLETLLKK